MKGKSNNECGNTNFKKSVSQPKPPQPPEGPKVRSVTESFEILKEHKSNRK